MAATGAVATADETLSQASPIIWKDLKDWKDGDGGEWNDVITCVDLVRQGVDHRQTPFEKVEDEQMVACGIAMGIPDGPPQVFRMQSDHDDGGVENQIDNGERSEPHPHQPTVPDRMDNGD